MFGGGVSNPYDDIVAKTTDENLTTENWELIMNLCDKVSDEGEEGPRNVISALLKRLAHRNPNVQLYALSLADSLSKNCGLAVNKEIASRAFTQSLEKLVTDRTTHDKVRKRALSLIAEWTSEYEDDSTLGIMEDCYNNLKSKGYKFEALQEPLPPTVDDEIRRKEEEELQRVLEMSVQDRGGRNQWAQYSLATGSSSGAPSASGSGTAGSSSRPGATSSSGIGAGASGSSHAAPKYQGGYAPARTPSPKRQDHQSTHLQPQPQQQQQQQPQRQQSPQTPSHDHPGQYIHSNASNTSANSIPPPSATTTSTVSTTTTTNAIVTRVRALHMFEPTEPGELAFEKGDIIKVVDRGYKDWWRGQLKGRTGIFPVNYVEPMPEPTAAELAREAEQEAAVFAQAVNVEKLLNLLRAFDPTKDNLADNEEIQELYRSSMALRPKIVKLIDKYSQKRADLVSMNETFVRARTIFDRMMEESLARHTGIYDHPQPPYRPTYSHAPSASSMRPDSRTGGRAGRQDYGLSPIAGSPGYPGYAQVGPAGVPQSFPEPQPAPPVMAYPATTPGPMTSPTQTAYAYGSTLPQPQAQLLQPQIQPGQAPQQIQTQPQSHPVQQQPQTQPQSHPVQQQPQYQQQPQPSQQPGYNQAASPPYTAEGPVPYPTQQSHQTPASSQPQPQQQPQGQPQLQVQPQYGQSPYPTQFQPQAQDQTSPHTTLPAQSQPQQQPAQQQVQQAQLSPQPQHASLQSQHQQHPQHQQVQPQQVQPQQVQPQQVQSHQVQPQPQPVQTQPAQQPQASQESTIQQAQQAQPTQQVAQAHPVQHQQQHQPSVQSGPPYIFDPNATYSDPNVQAWAQYYAQGGTDLAGSVYFVSIPGLTDGDAGGAPVQGGVGQGGVQDLSGGSSGGQQDHGGAQLHQQHQQGGGVDSGMYRAQTSGSFFDSSSATPHQQHPQQQPSNASSASLGAAIPNPYATSTTAPGGGAPALGQSPNATNSTPSWVLPKKDGASRSPARDFQGLSGQFAGVALTDPGSASA